MDKSFEMKMDTEDIVDDGWGRHKADDEVCIRKYVEMTLVYTSA